MATRPLSPRTYPFLPPGTSPIGNRNTRKNDNLSHLPAFRRRVRRESPPRSDPGATQYNRPHQCRSKRTFRHEGSLASPSVVAFGLPPEFFARGKAGCWSRLWQNCLSTRRVWSADIADCYERRTPARAAGKNARPDPAKSQPIP